MAEAARLQFFHYNTMRYRVSKLERLLGPFTTDPHLRLNVAVALQVLEMPSSRRRAVVNATLGGVLGRITVGLYGMIGLVGAKIWVENNVDFGNPVNMVGLSAGLIAGIGGVSLKITDDFTLSGIALGTILVIVYFHLVKGRSDAMGAREVTKVL